MIGHHQWLTLSACVLMWGPCLVERLFEMSKWSTQRYDNGIVVPKSGGSESDNNQGTLVELQSFFYSKLASSKGQTISKGNHGFLNSSKKWTKLTILSREDAQNSGVCSFFGRIEDIKNCFQDQLTINISCLEAHFFISLSIFYLTKLKSLV